MTDEIAKKQFDLDERRFAFEQRKWKSEGDRSVLDSFDRTAEVADRYWELTLKTITILNGGAALALLTFAGNSPETAKSLLWSLPVFGLGAATSGIASLSSYLSRQWEARDTRLEFAKLTGIDNEVVLKRIGEAPFAFKTNAAASRVASEIATGSAAVGLGSFVVGLVSAACGLR